MDEQFVDFYQILELPLDADRNTLRKRINELYLDAQSNLDHRNFDTRLKFQQLFEAILPQARFILLDDARRAQYLDLVRVFRASGRDTAPPVPRETPRKSPRPETTRPETPASPQRFARTSQTPPDAQPYDPRGAQIEPLPGVRPAAEPLEAQREELWKKWKIGLEEALDQQNSAPKSTASTASADQNLSRRDAFATPNSTPDSAPVSPALQETLHRQSASQPPDDTAVTSSPGVEAGRSAHRREITREMLVNVNLIWSSIGALGVVVPGLVALVEFIDYFYPRAAAPRLSFPENWLWLIGFSLIGIGAFFAARELAKAMRRRKADELSALSYEELLRRNRTGSR